MATSGSKNYSVTRTEIINAALRKCGAFDSGEAPEASDSADAVLALNLMVKEWSSRGLDLPWRAEITVFLDPDTQSYTVGPSGSHATTSYFETTLAASASGGATSLTLTSTSGITSGDFIGVKLDTGVFHWTTTNASASVIGVALPSAAASGNKVFTYTTKAYRPQKIIYAFRRDRNGIDTPVELIGEVAYRGLSRKSTDGPVNQAFYSPTLTNGTLRVWPAGTSDIDKLILIAQYPVDDFDAAGDNPQFPIEWGNALIWNLAVELAPEYDVSLKEQANLQRQAVAKLETLFDYDVENASVTLGLDV